MVSATASMRVLYVLVAMEAGSRRILHTNVTAHPTAEWTIQQLRECFTYGHPYRYLIHDRDSVFSAGLDSDWKGFGLRVWKTPIRAPKANAYCERLIGTIRREYLDRTLFWTTVDLEAKLTEFQHYYNGHRTHAGLEGGLPEPDADGSPSPIDFRSYRWRRHCRGLYQTPIAA